MSYRDDQAAHRRSLEVLLAERAALARSLAPLAELQERADRLTLEIERLCARAAHHLPVSSRKWPSATAFAPV